MNTGLIYVGNGQYYDPATGRFLTRGVNPNSANPYIPWNPIGAVFGPFALVSIYYSRKKGKRSPWLALIFMAVILAACQCPIPNPFAPATPTPTQPPVATQPPSTSTQAPTETLPPPTPTETPAPTPQTCDPNVWAPGSDQDDGWGKLEIIAKRLYFEGTSSFTETAARKKVFMAEAWALRTLRWNYYGTSYMDVTQNAFSVGSSKDKLGWYDDNNYVELTRCILNAQPCSSGPNPWGGGSIIQWLSSQNLNRRDQNGSTIWITSDKVPDCTAGCQLPDVRSRAWLLNLKPEGYAERFWDLGNVGTGFANECYWGGIYFFDKTKHPTAFDTAVNGIYYPPPTQQLDCPKPANHEYVESLPNMPNLPSPSLP